MRSSRISDAPERSRGGSLRAYGLSVAAVAMATAVRFPLEPLLRGRAPYGLYFLAILWAAWYAGTGPTFAAIALSLASAAWFSVPWSEPGYVATIGLFLVVALALLVTARGVRVRRDERSFLAAVVDSSDDAIITKNLDGVIQSWNGGAQRLFGYRAEEIVGRSITLLIPVEHLDEEQRIMARLRRGERIRHFETVRVTKDGRPIDVSLTVSPVRDRYGNVIGASKAARDISDLKRAARDLAAEREWLGSTLRSIGDAVICTDASGRVVFLNPVAERLTGWSNAGACGKSCEEVFHVVNEHTREIVESPVARVLRSGSVMGLANGTVLVAADGTEHVIDDSGAPIILEGGRVEGVVLVFRDISDRRRLEGELREASMQREQLLEGERSARNEAENASRSKDEFVAMVSHELRTPLSSILGWTGILKTRPHDVEMGRRGIQVIERSARTQERLVSDLLDMSRIITGKLRLDVGDVDLIALIEAAVETTRPAAEAKGISVSRRLDPSIAAAAGDPTRLEQCIWNLLANAIKFTPQGGRVSVELARVDSHVEIRIADSGAGITPDLLPFVFERFRQGESSATGGRSGGLGLGLAIVKRLIELHGGRVHAESHGAGYGAIFTLSLPVHVLRKESALRAVPSHGEAVLDDVRVLLVEDDADTRDVLRTFLEQRHASVATAASSREALEMIPATHASILVSDIGLPGIDGYELIRRIRETESDFARIPAIALTAHARPEDRTRALCAGFQAHLAKPVEPLELAATIKSLAVIAPRRVAVHA